LLLQCIGKKRSGKAVWDMPPNDFPALQGYRKPIAQRYQYIGGNGPAA
jgi:hypothetical protein